MSLSVSANSAINLPDPRPEEKVSLAAYLFYTSILYVITPLVIFAKICAVVKQRFSKHDENYHEFKKNIKTLIDGRESSDLTQGLTIAHLLGQIQNIPKEGQAIIKDVMALYPSTDILSEILCGACTQIEDEGHFYDEWRRHLTGSNEINLNAVSSHGHLPGVCFRISGVYINEFLCWKNKDTTHTFFQIEANPARLSLKKIEYLIFHFVDYLNYKRTNRQQSPFGTSPYTEDRPIKLQYNREAFRDRRVAISHQAPTGRLDLVGE